MSLQSNGSTFEVIVPLGDHRFQKAENEYGGLTHKKKFNPKYQNYHLCSGHTLEDKKKAFLELMQDFANSSEFEVLTYDTMNDFQIDVRVDLNLSL